MILKIVKENQQSFQNLPSNLDLDWFCLGAQKKSTWHFMITFWEIFMKKWSFQERFRIILGRFPELQDIKKHDFGWLGACQNLAGTSKNMKNMKKSENSKIEKVNAFISRKVIRKQCAFAFGFFSFHRICRTWLLEQLLAKCKFRACWKIS